jgi:hypothetical protein
VLSSAGRASPLQGECRRFDPVSTHSKTTTYASDAERKSDSSKFRPSLNFSRLYRAHVQPSDWRGAERTAFVEAFSHSAAVKKIAAAGGALEHRSPDAVADRIYNCYSSKKLIDEGLSESHELLPWNVVTQLNQPAAVPEAMAA